MNFKNDQWTKIRHLLLLKKLPETVELLQAMSKEQPKSPEIPFLTSLCYLYSFNYAKALGFMAKAIATGKTEPMAYYAAFVCCAQLCDFHQASRYYQLMRGLNGTITEIELNKQLTSYFEREDFSDNIIRRLEGIIKQRPDSCADEYYDLGRAYETQMKFDQAVYCYSKSIAQAAVGFNARVKLGYLFAKLKKDEDAEEVLDTLLENHNQNPLAYLHHSLFRLISNDYTTALKELTLSKKLQNNLPDELSENNIQNLNRIQRFLYIFFDAIDRRETTIARIRKISGHEAPLERRDSNDRSCNTDLQQIAVQEHLQEAADNCDVLKFLLRERAMLNFMEPIAQPEIKAYLATLKFLVYRILKLKNYFETKLKIQTEKEVVICARYFCKMIGFVVPHMRTSLKDKLSFLTFFSENGKSKSKDTSQKTRGTLLNQLSQELIESSEIPKRSDEMVDRFVSILVFRKAFHIINCRDDSLIMKESFTHMCKYIDTRCKPSFMDNFTKSNKQKFFLVMREHFWSLKKGYSEQRQLAVLHAFIFAAIVAQGHLFDAALDLNDLVNMLADKFIANAFVGDESML
jgi:tetratricopeptide (TPR) repeat protein